MTPLAATTDSSQCFDGLARVVAGPTFAAPWSGLEAIVVVWRFSSARGRVLASGVLGDSLFVDTALGLVEVPLEGTEFVLAAPSDIGEHISQPIPAVFEPVLPRLIDRGGSGLYAREERLVARDVLHLVADRVLPSRRDPYRSAARAGAEAAWCVDTRRGRSRIVGSWLLEPR